METSSYNPQIFIDDVELLDWSGFEVSRRIGEGETGFSVNLNSFFIVMNLDSLRLAMSYR